MLQISDLKSLAKVSLLQIKPMREKFHKVFPSMLLPLLGQASGVFPVTLMIMWEESYRGTATPLPSHRGTFQQDQKGCNLKRSLG